MILTLRPTGLRTAAAFAHLADWCVIEDGEEIGRIYQVHAASPPGFCSRGDELEHHELGGGRRQGSLRPYRSMTGP
jgi:hypothetical protein